jgi:hypothetical protein
MHARCRRSMVWVVSFLMVALAGWAGARRAAAADLQSVLEAPCAQTAQVAAFAAPDWAEQGTESGTMGTEAPGMEKPMGHSCTTNGQCHDKKMWCSKPNGQCKGKGECMAKPDVCPDIVDPVCGCNGRTYNNECMAHRAGVNVRRTGKCTTPKKRSSKPAASSTSSSAPATPSTP